MGKVVNIDCPFSLSLAIEPNQQYHLCTWTHMSSVVHLCEFPACEISTLKTDFHVNFHLVLTLLTYVVVINSGAEFRQDLIYSSSTYLNHHDPHLLSVTLPHISPSLVPLLLLSKRTRQTYVQGAVSFLCTCVWISF